MGFFLTFATIFMQKHRYIKNKEGLFVNTFTEEYLDPKTIIIRDEHKKS